MHHCLAYKEEEDGPEGENGAVAAGGVRVQPRTGSEKGRGNVDGKGSTPVVCRRGYLECGERS